MAQDKLTGRLVFDPPEVRFWKSVARGGDDDCWPWTSSTDKNGYGWFSGFGERKAHRASWVLHNGPITGGRWVLHTCDNPPCVNPAHLYLGNAQDNGDDCVRRGRSKGKNVGVANANAKMTEAKVIAMRTARVRGASIEVLCHAFDVTPATVFRVTLGQSWKHVGGPIAEQHANRVRAGHVAAAKRLGRPLHPLP